MKGQIRLVIATILAALACGSTFLLALYRQFALVEVAASLATGAQAYFLSAAIGDLLDKKEPQRWKLGASVGIAVSVIAYFLIMRYAVS
jgi:hypothetical protein